jgi:hypothetical protein
MNAKMEDNKIGIRDLDMDIEKDVDAWMAMHNTMSVK